MAASELVRAGLDVLMLERGDWVERGPHNWEPDGTVDLTTAYSYDSPYRVEAGGTGPVMGAYSCVGGPSVFYGGVSLRFREADFHPDPEIVGDSGAVWPVQYDDLEPWYARAEAILGVAGAPGDPTEPPRSSPYPHAPIELAAISGRIDAAARALGLHPFRLPLAINYTADGRTACRRCATCDTFACAVSAKNDLATAVLPALIARGLELRPNVVVTRLVADGARVEAVEFCDVATGERAQAHGTLVFVAGGALGTPHLLL